MNRKLFSTGALGLMAQPVQAMMALLVALGVSGCPSGQGPGTDPADGSDLADLASAENVVGPQDLNAEVQNDGTSDGQAQDTAADLAQDAGQDNQSDEVGTPVDPLESFFSLEAVHSIKLSVDAAGVASLLAQPKVYVRGSVWVDDQFYNEVGVRLKGSMGSFVPLDEQQAWGRTPGKSAFIIDFNRYVKGQDHLGLKKLTVNNMAQDPSGIHQYLGYSLFREGGVPASRSGFATVSFNENKKGLYALVETPDNEEFLERWFTSDKGNLYEGSSSDLTADEYAAFDQDRGDDTSKEDLRLLSEALDAAPVGDGAYDVLAASLDLDEYLTYAATEIYLSHWDGYAWNTNNYIIYHDVQGARWAFVPWGIDQLFDEAEIMGPYHGLMKSPGPSWQTPARGFDSMLQGGRVQEVCYLSPKCRAKLGQAYREVIDRASGMGLAQMAQEARQLVEPLILEETTAYGDPNATLAALDKVQLFIQNRPAELEKWLPCLDGAVVDGDGDTFDGCVSDCNDVAPATHPGAAELCNLADDDCDGVLDNNPECPECYDLVLASGTYSMCFHPATWQVARERCQERGQELASIHDENTNMVLPWNLLEKTGYSESWIGLNDVESEGNFTWTDGSALDYDYRIVPLPPEWAEYLDCVAYTVILGWLPLVCWDERAFICKTP